MLTPRLAARPARRPRRRPARKDAPRWLPAQPPCLCSARGQAGRLAPPGASQAAGYMEYPGTQLVPPLTALSWHCRAAGRP
eukprot:8865729-Alexandrium_andersonii.AAC.1